MVLRINLTESNAQIEAKILKAIAEDVNKSFSQKINLVKDIFSRNVYDAVVSCPEMNSVSSGVLKIDFGLLFDPVVVIAIATADSVNVQFNKVNNKLTTGGFSVTVQPLDYLNLLSLPQAINITEKGITLPWLEWLLTYGDSIIIADFGVKYTRDGRTGGGYMSPEAKPFIVNSMFSGTVDNNFITRAIDAKLNNIENDLIRAFS